MYRVFNLIMSVAEEHCLGSQYKLSRYLGIPQSALSYWQNGKRLMPLEQALIIANMLCIKEDDIVACYVADIKDRMKMTASA